MNIWRVEYSATDIDEGWIVPAASPQAAIRKALAYCKDTMTATEIEVHAELLHKNMTWHEYKALKEPQP